MAIVIWNVLALLFAALSMTLVITGALEISAEDQAIMRQFGAIDWAISAAMSAIILLATIYLFAMRKVAAYLLTTHFLAHVISVAYNLALDRFAQFNSSDWAGYGLGVAVQFMTLAYVWHLFRRGLPQ